MFAYENDDFFVNITLSDFISRKLLDYQFLHIFNLMTSLRDNKIVLDGSDPGTGKTYTSLALCKQLDLRPFIICPKTIMTTWAYVCKIFDITPLAIVNYESIKEGKCYDNDGKRIDCKYIDITELDEKTIEFTWLLPKPTKCIIIFDEVHKCKNQKSLNGKLLLSTLKQESKVLMLSGTLADKPESFHIFGYMLGFYKNIRRASFWIKGMIREDLATLNTDKNSLSAINKKLYPDKGSRMRIVELGSKFPENQVSADCYYIKEKDRLEVNKYFQQFLVGDTELKGADGRTKEHAQVLANITKARQQLELIKVQIIKDLVDDYTENGYNVAIFVNYTETINQLSTILNTKCIVNGQETVEKRKENIDMFQNNQANVIICNIAITEGLDLHDLHGVPRVSLISPSFRSDQLAQTLSRIHRAGAKTPALQRIIFCSGTCEEVICNRLKHKLKFMAKLNDNDLIKID